MVLYTIFLGFEKYRVSAQNSKGSPFGFTNERWYTVKMDRKSVFHLCEAYILAQLDITVVYTIS
jgi:hypothetical protein